MGNNIADIFYVIFGIANAIFVSLGVATLIKYGLQLISWQWSAAGTIFTLIVTILNFKFSIALKLCISVGGIGLWNEPAYYYVTIPYVCGACMIYVSVMVLLENCIDMIVCLNALLKRTTITAVSKTDPDILLWEDQLHPLLAETRMKALSRKQ